MCVYMYMYVHVHLYVPSVGYASVCLSAAGDIYAGADSSGH